LGYFTPEGKAIDPPAAIVWAFVAGKTPEAKELGGNHAGK